MLEKVISGGQTGADQAALRAARAAGICTGGFAPMGWLTEDGPKPDLAEYGLVECASSSYPYRTKRNIATSDASLVFSYRDSPGTDLALAECERRGKDYRVILMDKAADGMPGFSRVGIPPKEIAEWIVEKKIRVLNVAGHRESKVRGIGRAVEVFMGMVFAELKRLEANNG